jgi:L-lysine 2,3-aminomutase
VSNYLAIEDYIYRHPKINEVILSGGDPLSLSDEKLAPINVNNKAGCLIQTNP